MDNFTKENNNSKDPLGLLKNESNPEDLFSKMETNLSADETIGFEEDSSIDQEDSLLQEQRSREEAKIYLKKYNSLSDNYVLGFIGALLGGLVGAIPWAIVSSAGWFVAWLGYVIAIAASKGYDLMKVKAKMIKIWFVAIAVIVSVFAGQIMSDMISVATDSELNGMFMYVFEYFVDNFAEYLSINAVNLVLGLVFAVIGGFSVLKEIKQEIATVNYLKAKYPEE